jgi:glycosyltransferase involved in cell wall biosynthesis
MRKRVAYIVSMRHGLPAFTHREITELRRQDMEVDCFVMRDGSGPYMPEPDWGVVRVNRWKLVFTLLGVLFRRPAVLIRHAVEAISLGGLVHYLIALQFVGHLEQRKIDVIYCFEGKHALWIGYFCRLFTGLPLTVIVHAEMVDTSDRVELTRRSVEQCERVITITDYNKDRIMAQFGVPADRIEVVRLFAEFKRDERLKVMIVGEFAGRKGHETLFRALMEPEMDDFVVWVVGGGNWGDDPFDAHGFVEQNGLGDRVVFWGRVPEALLTLLYESCHIFCLPSKTSASGVTEGLPVSLMEGMFFGKPVVSTYHTGIPELVPEILVEENDHRALAEGLRRLRSPELRAVMGERNRQIVLEEYSKNNVRQLADILEGGAR